MQELQPGGQVVFPGAASCQLHPGEGAVAGESHSSHVLPFSHAYSTLFRVCSNIQVLCIYALSSIMSPSTDATAAFLLQYRVRTLDPVGCISAKSLWSRNTLTELEPVCCLLVR